MGFEPTSHGTTNQHFTVKLSLQNARCQNWTGTFIRKMAPRTTVSTNSTKRALNVTEEAGFEPTTESFGDSYFTIKLFLQSAL